jgi:hypothetical protein
VPEDDPAQIIPLLKQIAPVLSRAGRRRFGATILHCPRAPSAAIQESSSAIHNHLREFHIIAYAMQNKCQYTNFSADSS